MAAPEPERLSKAAQKNKKKRDAKKKSGGGGGAVDPTNMSSEQRDVVQMAKYLLNDPPNKASESAADATQKKIKGLKKVLCHAV